MLSEVTAPLFEIADDHAADGRLTCETAGRHVPGCHNPQHGLTACICGAMWWRGEVGTWHINWAYPVKGTTVAGNVIRTPEPNGAYFMHAAGCSSVDPSPGFEHLCADVKPASAAETWGKP